ncbi:Na+/H+ antiporter subunit E [Phytohalomonas tamaricis]|uniref:Na+/H+ antiporter subunit E n=1 Tax=Phytohalomonas tamaricis TaxID=2081032 RepID=UPI000D0B7C27|nr:Na+/H+ antiporter subunit E [Phytohalomonas tamaricis]
MIPATRWVPTPLLSLLLAAIWILVTSLSPGNILLGVVLGLIIPKLTQQFWDKQPDVKRPWLAIKYIFVLFIDIIVANFEVSRVILAIRRKPQPAFIVYPLSMSETFPITVLANTISLTPGTLSAHLRLHDGTLLIHALDVDDIDGMIRHIHERYELPLKEIFGC